MINETFYAHGKNYKQINKRTARNLFDNGETIYLQSSNMRFSNPWQYPCPISIKRDSAIGNTFDDHCNDYKYYNCDKERGKYIHFFVEV